MAVRDRRPFRSLIAAGVVLALGAQFSAHAQKGRKISVGDDPFIKDGSPGLVIIEVLDYE